MKPLSHLKNDVRLTFLLLTIPLVTFLFAPGFFTSRPTLAGAAEHNHHPP
ncbi:MAG: hypothetical protein RLO18_03010 [Gimesia chilikensis]